MYRQILSPIAAATVFLAAISSSPALSLYVGSPDDQIQMINLGTGTKVGLGPNTYGSTGATLDPVSGDLYISTYGITKYFASTGNSVSLPSYGNNWDLIYSGQSSLYSLTSTQVNFSKNNSAVKNLPNANPLLITSSVVSATAIAVDSTGKMYIAGGTPGLKSIYTVSSPGAKPEVFVNSTAMLDTPTGLAFDSLGNLYISDMGLDSILRVTAEGVVSMFAGSDTGLRNPMDIVFDEFDNMYVVNAGRGSILKYTPEGEVSTFASGLLNPSYIAIGPDWTHPVPEPSVTFLLLLGATVAAGLGWKSGYFSARKTS